jgi:anti-sigma regulatory factor (Ser/Thr protein kinase)
MSKLLRRGEQIRQFILANVEAHPNDIATLAAQEFDVTRQAINKHMQALVEQKALTVSGSTRNKRYHLHPLIEWKKTYALTSHLEEDRVWDADIKSLVADLPDNIRAIWSHGFHEMLNNAIDHSSGTGVLIQAKKTAIDTEIMITDNGEGIFKKIQRELALYDERHAVLELSKGKLTTDPERHSGQGVFFTSRMFDKFAIFSGSTCFSHEFNKPEDWILEGDKSHIGTSVLMKLDNNTSRTPKQIFDDFSSGDDYGFTKTVVPVRLAQYGDETLVSRSQARRLLARVDKFKVVIFDFADVSTIGQAFADEIFRVFRNRHPEIKMTQLNACKEVEQMAP